MLVVKGVPQRRLFFSENSNRVSFLLIGEERNNFVESGKMKDVSERSVSPQAATPRFFGLPEVLMAASLPLRVHVQKLRKFKRMLFDFSMPS